MLEHIERLVILYFNQKASMKSERFLLLLIIVILTDYHESNAFNDTGIYMQVKISSNQNYDVILFIDLSLISNKVDFGHVYLHVSVVLPLPHECAIYRYIVPTTKSAAYLVYLLVNTYFFHDLARLTATCKL